MGMDSRLFTVVKNPYVSTGLPHIVRLRTEHNGRPNHNPTPILTASFSKQRLSDDTDSAVSQAPVFFLRTVIKRSLT